MPIPQLNEHGVLPVGLHMAAVEEIAGLFGGGSVRRQELTVRLERLVDLARHVRARRLLIDGSFVSGKAEPGDLDVVIWVDEQYLQLLAAEDPKAQSLEWQIVGESPDDVFAVYTIKWAGMNGWTSSHASRGTH